MASQMDILFVSPGGRRQGYQRLGRELSGVEPPLWIGLLAGNLRDAGYSVAVVDSEAEGLDADDVAARVAAAQPRLTMVVAFGANPSASTQKMTSAGAICSAIRRAAPECKTMLAGLHVSALPERTLREEDVTFVCQGEGPRTLQPLLDILRAGGEDFSSVPGLWYRKDGRIVGQDICYYTNPGAKTTVRINRAMQIVADRAEFEVSRERNVANFHGRSYDLVQVRGELKLRNALDKDVNIEVTKMLSGKILQTSEEPTVTAVAKGLKAVNTRQRLVWKLRLEAGQDETLDYSYEVYIRR